MDTIKDSASAHPQDGTREVRTCAPCEGVGAVVLNATYDMASGHLTKEIGDCPVCGGKGTVSVFLYGARG